jgi:hypothetical protein
MLPQGSERQQSGSPAGLDADDYTAMEVEATKRRTEITIETERVLMISGRRKVSIVTWCDGCDKRVRMCAAEEAAALSSVPVRQIYRWIECGVVHFVEEPNALLICTTSFTEAVARQTTNGPRSALVQADGSLEDEAQDKHRNAARHRRKV